MGTWNLLPVFLLGFVSPARSFDFNSTCSSIASQIAIPNATVSLADFVPAGTNLTFPDNDPSCARPFQIVLVDMCRIAMTVATSNRSGFDFEAWLPRNWTGRFLSTGNGGLSGCESTALPLFSYPGFLHHFSFRYPVRRS
ncbi:hypothetical protein K435DRAFT_786972, partial [Dendrothele bispora CBS 962.96]